MYVTIFKNKQKTIYVVNDIPYKFFQLNFRRLFIRKIKSSDFSTAFGTLIHKIFEIVTQTL